MTNDRWEIDSSHSGIHFSVRHMVVAKVRGQFARWSGTVLAAEDGTFDNATVSVVIDATSIETGVADRDGHLKSADFLDVAKFPELTFTGKRVAGTSTIAGELSIHGVTRPVSLDVEYAGTTKDPWGHVRAGFSARTSINRKEFGLDWNQVLEAGGLLVGEKIEIELEIEAVKQEAVAVA